MQLAGGSVLAPSGSIPKLSHDDMVTKAEVYETLRVCLADQSFASTSGISDLMRSMFPDSKIANDMKLQRTKMVAKGTNFLC